MKILVHGAGHSIIEYPKLEDSHKRPTSFSSQKYLKLNCLTKSIMQTLLEPCQAWCCHHFPGWPVPVTDHPVSEEHFLNVQPELSLMELHSIFLYPIVGHQRVDTNMTLPTVTFHSCRLWWVYPSAFSEHPTKLSLNRKNWWQELV